MVKRVIDSIKKKLRSKNTPAKAEPMKEEPAAKPSRHPRRRPEARRTKTETRDGEVYQPGAGRKKSAAKQATAAKKEPVARDREEPRREPRKDAEGQEDRPRRRRRRRRKKTPAQGEAIVLPGTPARTAEEPRERKAKEAAAADEPWDPASFVVPEKEGATRFVDLDLPVELLHGVAEMNFQYCTPIQAESLPTTLKGIDLSGKAQTGTGKTAAFLITAFANMLRNPITEDRRNGTPRALVIAPTRELVMQIEKDARDISRYTNINTIAVFGGVDYEKQKQRLTHEVIDLVVATPGRLLDFKRRHDIHLNHVETLVIDEADRMLDMGFIPDVRNIVHSTPPKTHRQTMLFSATLTPDVTRLASQWTKDSVTVEIEPENVAVDTVEQIVYITTAKQKFALLYNIIKQENGKQVIVFGNRRDQTRGLTDALRDHGIECALLSGEVPQAKRMRTLEDFKGKKFQVLVATDVAGRGLHIDDISHVVNYDLPQDAEDYVHRIGRTGRAGAAGTSVSFACEEDSFYIPEIETYMGRALQCTYPDESLLAPPPDPVRRHPREKAAPKRPSRSGGGRGRPGGGRRPPRRS